MPHFLDSHEMLALLWRATWQSAVLALLVGVTILVSRRWLTATWRVLLWTLPLFRMLILVAPASGLSVFNSVSLLTESRSNSQKFSATAQSSFSSEELQRKPRVASWDTNESLEPARQAEVLELINLPGRAEEDHLKTNQSASQQVVKEWSIATIILAVWLVGILVQAARWCWSSLVLRRTLAKWEPLERKLWEQLKPVPSRTGRFAVMNSVRCLVSDQDLGPATCGVFRPTILLPKQLVNKLTTDQLRSILCHEYQHIRRFDILLMALCRCVKTIHWFNPLAYIISGLVRREMEIAVDAATIDSLEFSERLAYGHLLIELSQRPVGRFGLVQMANCRSDVKARIEALLNPLHSSVFHSAFAVAIISMFLVVGCTQEKDTTPVAEPPPATPAEASNALNVMSDSEASSNMEPSNKIKPTSTAEAQETLPTDANHAEQKYYVVGTVREAGTNEPIAGAEVGLLVETEQEPEKRVPKGITDSEGRYRIEVPMGSVQLWFPWLKPGYWLASGDTVKQLVTSPDKPEVVHDIIAHRAPVWQLQAIGDVSDAPMISAMEEPDATKRAAIIKGEYVSWDETPPSAFGQLDSTGRGSLTQVGISGGLIVSVVNVRAEMVVEPGFDNNRVVTAERLPDSAITQMIDEAGRMATVTEATVTLHNGAPLLTFQLKSTEPKAFQKLTGNVVDEQDKPISGVRVGAAGRTKGGGGSVWPVETTTNQDGSFELEVPIHRQSTGKLQFAVIITADGYAALDTAYQDVSDDLATIDFGTIKLANGRSLPLLVVDQEGRPLAGVSVEPGDAYSLRSQAARTDANGRVTLRNLPFGVLRVHARLGNLSTHTKLVISRDDSENLETTVTLVELPAPSLESSQPTSEQEPIVPVGIGTQAPDWDLKEWSDGKDRKLSDFRGKVLVLDFWGIWCSPCVTAIPSMQALAEKYESKDVVFLGIHTPDGDVEQINKLKKLHGWTAPSGIDRGTSIADGKTSSMYGIRGYPSILIVDRHGKIAFNSSIEPTDRKAFLKERRELAKSVGVTLPLNTNAPQSELDENMARIMQAQLSREIDRVLQ